MHSKFRIYIPGQLGLETSSSQARSSREQTPLIFKRKSGISHTLSIVTAGTLIDLNKVSNVTRCN